MSENCHRTSTLKRFAGIVLAALSCACASVPDAGLQALATTYEENYARSDDPVFAYRLARIAAIRGQSAEQEKWLRILLEAGWRMGVDDTAIPAGSNREINAILARLEAAIIPGEQVGQVVFTLQDALLIPESIAWDARRQRLLAGSLYRKKVILQQPDRVSNQIVERDFATRAGRPLGAIYGIKFDAERDQLWVLHNPRKDGLFRGELSVFAADGRALRNYRATGESSAEWNDLCLTAESVFVTDVERGHVLRGSRAGIRLEEMPIDIDLLYPNGIACDDRNDSVLVADASGIVRISSDATARRIETPAGVSLGGIDGLYVNNGQLIGIQNSVGRPKVLFVQLDPDGRVTALRAANAFEGRHRIPTTGFVAGSCFYYIANSSIDALSIEGELVTEAGPPDPALILALPLRPGTQSSCDLYH